MQRDAKSYTVIILTWMAATHSATHLSVYQMNLIPAGHNKTRQELKNS